MSVVVITGWSKKFVCEEEGDENHQRRDQRTLSRNQRHYDVDVSRLLLKLVHLFYLHDYVSRVWKNLFTFLTSHFISSSSHTIYSLFLSNYWLPKTRISVSHSLSLTVDDDCSLFGPWLPVSRLDHYFHWNSWLSSPLADPSFLKKWESERTFTLATQKVSLSNGIVKLYSRFTNSLTYFPASRSSSNSRTTKNSPSQPSWVPWVMQYNCVEKELREKRFWKQEEGRRMSRRCSLRCLQRHWELMIQEEDLLSLKADITTKRQTLVFSWKR